MTATASQTRADVGWWTRPFEMFQTNLREIDATLDVETTLDAIEAFGADTWLVNAGGILSFYPTDLPFQTRNPHLAGRASGDLLGDAVAAAHARGIRVMARMDFSKVAEPIADAHPDWCFVAPDGSRQIYNGLVSVCPSASYYQEKTFEIIDEVLERYDVDGFFFNWFGFNEVDYSERYWGVSQTEASRRGFAEYSGGKPLPTGPESPEYDEWRAWSAGVIADLAARIHAHIASRKPEAALILGRAADILFHEANNALGRELWATSTSEAVSAFRTKSPETPVLVNSVAFIDMPYRLAAEEPPHMVQYQAQALARGANPSTYIMGAPGMIDYPLLTDASRITRFHAQHREVYDHLVPAAEIGVVRPSALRVSTDDWAHARAEFRGVYESLQEEHVVVDVVPAEALGDIAARGGLRRFRALVLADTGELDADAVAALDTYARGGGRLLLTGGSAIASDGSSQLAMSPIARVAATQSDPERLKSTYVAAEEMVAVYGTHHDVELRDGASKRLEHLGPAPFGPPEKAYGNEPDGQPGYVLSADGHVAVVPWTIGRGYHDLGLRPARRLLRAILDELDPSARQIVADLPESVEVTAQRGASGLVVHLVNLSGRRRRNFAPVLPIRGGTITIRTGVAARALVAGVVPAQRRTPDGLEISIDRLDDLEVLVVQEEQT